jgi:hypothetical protein
MQTIEYTNGDKYHGHLNSKGQRHGTGRHVSAHGSYDGQWKNDMKYGYGRFVWPNGAWYDGEWKDDLQDGNGKGVLFDGQYFEGGIERGMPKGNVLLRVVCVVDDCHAAGAPLHFTQRVISRELATLLGHPVGDCTPFAASFRMPNYDASKLIESRSLGLIMGKGTLADEANDGPIIHGTFREVYHELHMIEVDKVDEVDEVDENDEKAENEYVAYSALGHPLYQFKPDPVMPPMVAMTPEQEAFAAVSRAALKRSQQLERLAIARRQRKIAKGQLKLDKFRASKKDHGGGHRKSRRMRNITRRRHCK